MLALRFCLQKIYILPKRINKEEHIPVYSWIKNIWWNLCHEIAQVPLLLPPSSFLSDDTTPQLSIFPFSSSLSSFLLRLPHLMRACVQFVQADCAHLIWLCWVKQQGRGLATAGSISLDLVPLLTRWPLLSPLSPSDQVFIREYGTRIMYFH